MVGKVRSFVNALRHPVQTWRRWRYGTELAEALMHSKEVLPGNLPSLMPAQQSGQVLGVEEQAGERVAEEMQRGTADRECGSHGRRTMGFGTGTVIGSEITIGPARSHDEALLARAANDGLLAVERTGPKDTVFAGEVSVGPSFMHVRANDLRKISLELREQSRAVMGRTAFGVQQARMTRESYDAATLAVGVLLRKCRQGVLETEEAGAVAVELFKMIERAVKDQLFIDAFRITDYFAEEYYTAAKGEDTIHMQQLLALLLTNDVFWLRGLLASQTMHVFMATGRDMGKLFVEDMLITLERNYTNPGVVSQVVPAIREVIPILKGADPQVRKTFDNLALSVEEGDVNPPVLLEVTRNTLDRLNLRDPIRNRFE